MENLEGITTTEEFFGKRIKQLAKEKLYDSVRIYLEGRMENRGNPKFESGFLYDLFSLCEKEIIEREIAENNSLSPMERKQSDYLHTFGDLLVKAGLEKKHPYEITDGKLPN